VVTLGPLTQIGVVVAGFWLFVISMALACIVAGMAGQRIARRTGRQCPDCDYRARPVDLAIHHALDHEREKQ
jgi:hypothetical protein